MEIKKNIGADLEDGRTTRFLMGLIFVLASILVALEWNTGEGDDDDFADDMLEDVTHEMEMMPVAQQENRIALVQKKKQEATPQKIRVVDNEATPQTEELQKADSDQKGDITPEEGTKEEEPDFAPAQAELGDNPFNFHTVEDLPKFPGGAVELMKWLTRNLKYPYDAQRNKKEGKVVVQFIVNKDGTLSDLKIVKSAQYASLDREALRVMRMMPKWTPGVQNDKPCRTMVCIPVVFKL